ncbi:hypothetical protein F7Q99_38255 [Streptomyces kaniharaensis]|uniref:Uncharacterized protein n=1 Tax=Streptomyces kaniharaensis TaxID=212423 RepID=A0A6N7L595_9ACTN|nr:hypothetical protein [Streptomyces kaniharaensis]MQS17878.1 hypothetical protein [Streptomyces kaniharaensis]
MKLDITHIVTLAGSGFGFLLCVSTLGFYFFKNGRKFKFVTKKKFWMPYVLGLGVMVLASSCAGGLLALVSGFFTGAGNQGGTLVSRGLVGGDGAAPVAQHTQLTYSGSWIALAVLVFAGLFLWFAKKWEERLLMLSGALTGSTWGLSISLGGLAAWSGIPLANWLGHLIIG